MTTEGGLKAPTRHPLDLEDPDFYNLDKIEEEMRRVSDICHTCRRCFNLCNSFPVLFDKIDEGATGEVESLTMDDFTQVVDNCTLCDMCYMVKCPYVPPHSFNIDFPHLMLRFKAALRKNGKLPMIPQEISKIDRNSKIMGPLSKFINWATDEENKTARSIIEKTAGIHKAAKIPKIAKTTLIAQKNDYPANPDAPAFGFKKAVVYTTCFMNYNSPDVGHKLLTLLAHFGVEIELAYPGCCGMPLLEQGNLDGVASSAKRISAHLSSFEKDIIALVPSCALMLKSEWPLLLTDNAQVLKTSKTTFDIAEYLMNITRDFGAPEGMKPLDNKDVTLHLSCHSRAQNMGQKAAQLLNLIPNTTVHIIERCAGHGGSWGMMVDHFDVAMKIGKPVFDKATQIGATIASECPLAKDHIAQGTKDANLRTCHPLELLLESYGL